MSLAEETPRASTTTIKPSSRGFWLRLKNLGQRRFVDRIGGRHKNCFDVSAHRGRLKSRFSHASGSSFSAAGGLSTLLSRRSQIAYRLFRLGSRLLHGTPLRRIRFVTDFHSLLFRRMRRIGPYTVGPFTVEVDPRDVVLAKKLALYGEFTPYEVHLLQRLLGHGDLFVDVGANIGLFSLYASRAVGAKGRVLAVEPDPSNASLLRRNLHRNGCTNVEIFECAATNRSGTTQLFQHSTNRGNLSLVDLNNTGESIEVTTVRLDHLIDRSPRCVKIDVEGAEGLVMEGMDRVFREDPPSHLLLEFNPTFLRAFGTDPLSLVSALAQRGYRLQRLDEERHCLEPTEPSSLMGFAEDSRSDVSVLASLIERQS